MDEKLSTELAYIELLIETIESPPATPIHMIVIIIDVHLHF